MPIQTPVNTSSHKAQGSGCSTGTLSPQAAQKCAAPSSLVYSEQPRGIGPLLSAEDQMVLYAVLQDLANELRRIHNERKKH